MVRPEADYCLAKQDDAKKEEGEVNGVKKKTSEDNRSTWSGRLDFVMSALSYAVGMGNLWRFPYLCYMNGGGAFLIPYIIMVILAGFPLVLLEFSFGQYGRQGIVSIWKACPIFQGVGWAMFIMSAVVSIYYSMLIAWCMYYIFASFASDVPWRGCEHTWNTHNCADPQQIKNISLYNTSIAGSSSLVQTTPETEPLTQLANLTAIPAYSPRLPSDEFFHLRMLHISEGIDDIGYPIWQLVACLFFVWCVVFVSLSKGIHSSGKATYITALLPYIVLVILLVRGLMLDGAMDGILFYLKPKWNRLLYPGVWADAGIQVFFSFSCCWGGLITLATYNDFHNNILKDAIIVTAGDTLTSLFGGVVIFSFIGYLAHTLQVSVKEVATQGAGLAFIIYPQAVTTLPISQLWSVLFMIMLSSVGFGTMFALVQTVQTTLVDVFPSSLRKRRRPLYVLFGICAMTFIVGIPLTCKGGLYILQLLDKYVATYSVLFLGIVLCIALPWVYGLPRLFKDIELMIQRKLGLYWVIMWRFVTPGIIVLNLAFSLAGFSRTTYDGYLFPLGYDVFGWLIVASQCLCVPVLALYLVYTGDEQLTWTQRLRELMKPTSDWGPPKTPEPSKVDVEIPLQRMDAYA